MRRRSSSANGPLAGRKGGRADGLTIFECAGIYTFLYIINHHHHRHDFPDHLEPLRRCGSLIQSRSSTQCMHTDRESQIDMITSDRRPHTVIGVHVATAHQCNASTHVCHPLSITIIYNGSTIIYTSLSGRSGLTGKYTMYRMYRLHGSVNLPLQPQGRK